MCMLDAILPLFIISTNDLFLAICYSKKRILCFIIQAGGQKDSVMVVLRKVNYLKSLDMEITVALPWYFYSRLI